MFPEIRPVLTLQLPLPVWENYWGMRQSGIRRGGDGDKQGNKERLTWWRRSGLSSGFRRLVSLSGPLLSLAPAFFAFCGERRWCSRHSVWAAAEGLSSEKRWMRERKRERENSAKQILGNMLKDKHGSFVLRDLRRSQPERKHVCHIFLKGLEKQHHINQLQSFRTVSLFY